MWRRNKSVFFLSLLIKADRDNWTKRQRGSETIGIAIDVEIEGWGVKGCADIVQRPSLVIEASPEKEQKEKQTPQHSSTVPESIHSSRGNKTDFNKKPIPSTKPEDSAQTTPTLSSLSNPHQTNITPNPPPLSPHQSLAAIQPTNQPASLTTMHFQTPPAIVSEGNSTSAAPRRSQRSRKATARFAEGWYGERLPRLSAALGVAQSDNDRGDTVGGDLSSSDDDEGRQSSGFEVEDEGQSLGVVIEEEECEEEVAAVCVPGPRRSERARKATERFEQGWFGERLPRLGLALGVNVSGRVDR